MEADAKEMESVEEQEKAHNEDAAVETQSHDFTALASMSQVKN